MSSEISSVETSKVDQIVPSNATASETVYKRDRVYYMDNFTFLVENTLFKVPKQRFIEESEVFRDMVSLPQKASDDIEGTSDSAPIQLEGINKNEFRAFLQILYPSNKLLPLAPDSFSVQQWSSFIKLATLWLFSAATRRSAMQRLSTKTLTPHEKIILGRKHKMRKWLVEGYFEMVQAEASVSFKTAQEIGLETTLLLLRLREMDAYMMGYRLGYAKGGNVPASKVPQQRVSVADVESAFAEEIKEIEEEAKGLGLQAEPGRINKRKSILKPSTAS